MPKIVEIIGLPNGKMGVALDMPVEDEGSVTIWTEAEKDSEIQLAVDAALDREWHPIASAPKGDGRDYVILYDKHVCVGVWFEDRWKPIHSTETVHPTHWMPLPPKPTS